jgi:hypothetical protein
MYILQSIFVSRPEQLVYNQMAMILSIKLCPKEPINQKNEKEAKSTAFLNGCQHELASW